MNISEEKGYNFLLKQGYKPEDIIYQSFKTPDFVLKDGKCFEVKKLYGKTIWFTDKQFEIVKKTKADILIFSDLNEEPLIIKNEDLVEGINRKVYFNNQLYDKGIIVKIISRKDFSAIWLPVSLIEKLKQEGRKGETYADIIRRLLEKRGRKPKSSV
jgi:predicted CopG family antitoxin